MESRVITEMPILKKTYNILFHLGFQMQCLFMLLIIYLFCLRGFLVWLKYIPGISFRTDNEPFKVGPSVKNIREV